MPHGNLKSMQANLGCIQLINCRRLCRQLFKVPMLSKYSFSASLLSLCATSRRQIYEQALMYRA